MRNVAVIQHGFVTLVPEATCSYSKIYSSCANLQLAREEGKYTRGRPGNINPRFSSYRWELGGNNFGPPQSLKRKAWLWGLVRSIHPPVKWTCETSPVITHLIKATCVFLVVRSDWTNPCISCWVGWKQFKSSTIYKPKDTPFQIPSHFHS